MKTLKHNFKTAFGVVNLAGLIGYTECMAAILEYINSVNKIVIDSSELRQVIFNTNEELLELRYNESDEIQTELNSLTQKTNL